MRRSGRKRPGSRSSNRSQENPGRVQQRGSRPPPGGTTRLVPRSRPAVSPEAGGQYATAGGSGAGGGAGACGGPDAKDPVAVASVEAEKCPEECQRGIDHRQQGGARQTRRQSGSRRRRRRQPKDPEQEGDQEHAAVRMQKTRWP